MDKKLVKAYLKSTLNGAGYACAASTALVWAFPKLARRNLDPKSRIICGLTGLAWCIWQACSYQERLEEEVIEATWEPISTAKEDEDD